MVRAFLAVSLLIALARAAPAPGPLVVHERRVAPPAGFVRVQATAPTQEITLRIALKQNDLAGLENALLASSTPGSPQFGKHLSQAQVAAFVRPTQAVSDAVTSWLSANGVTSQSASPMGDWLTIELPASKANKLFGADFALFSHAATSTSGIRTLAYSVPSNLQANILAVHPTVVFPNTMKQGPMITTPFGAPAKRQGRPSVTPAFLQNLYGIPTAPATQGAANQMAISGFIDQFANLADLTSFLAEFRADEANATFATVLLDDGQNLQDAADAGIEANLDTQYSIGIGTGVPTTFYSVGDDSNDDLGGFLDLVNLLIAQDLPPTVLSTSYSFNEPELTDDLANALCAGYMQLSARGTSVLFSSGDGGVSGGQSQACTTFVPTFPSGCPFVTSVGATQRSPEVVASFSSGGFSNIFPQADFQASAVNSYLATIGSLNAGLFNASGRAFPDIAAQGVNYQIVLGGETGGVSGTSCSTPMLAGFFSLINDALIAAGGTPLGWLNPFLYGAPAGVFNDITSGDNPGCGTQGFPALAGWDPVTGLGTPNFQALLAAAMAAQGLA